MVGFYLAKLAYFFAVPTLSPCQYHRFFFIPPWYEYLPQSTDALGRCSPQVKFPGDIWLIGLAVLHMLLTIAGFLAVISVIVAGFEYITTQGNGEKGVAARKRIVNSIIGLALVIIATGAVSFIGNTVGKAVG